jgi:hypothetical protein
VPSELSAERYALDKLAAFLVANGVNKDVASEYVARTVTEFTSCTTPRGTELLAKLQGRIFPVPMASFHTNWNDLAELLLRGAPRSSQVANAGGPEAYNELVQQKRIQVGGSF